MCLESWYFVKHPLRFLPFGLIETPNVLCCSPATEKRPVLGIIGCMAERLKSKLFKEKAVDIIAGPDALRSVPGLINLFSQVGFTQPYARH